MKPLFNVTRLQRQRMLLDLSFNVSEQRPSRDMLVMVLLRRSRPLLNTLLHHSRVLHNTLLRPPRLMRSTRRLQHIELADVNQYTSHNLVFS
jgi:hypothetical protein